MSASWKQIIDLNKSRPSVFSALTDGTIFLGVANGFRGTAKGAEYFKQLVEEMQYKAEHHIGTMTEEEYRLVFVGEMIVLFALVMWWRRPSRLKDVPRTSRETVRFRWIALGLRVALFAAPAAIGLS